MNIGFRVDSSYTIGTGHIYRCLNLAKDFKKKNSKPIFLSKDYPGNINNLIKKNFNLKKIKFNKFKKKLSNKDIVEDANETIIFIKKNNIKLIFIDNYQLNELWENLVSKYCKIVLISDDLKRKTKCDYLINYNCVYENLKNYKRLCKINCKRLIGPDYSIIKKSNNKTVAKKKKISVYLGGVDTKDYTTKIISVLKIFFFNNYEILIIIGQKNIRKKKIIDEIKKYKNFKFLIGDKKNLFNSFKNSSLVISNAGTSMYEHMTLGLKALIIPQTALQKNICKNLSITNLINFSSSMVDIDEKKISYCLKDNITFEKSEELKSIYDGNGSKRIVEYFKGGENINKFKLRKVKKEDKYFLFRLANDEAVIKNSISAKEISFKKHQEWFEKKLANKKTKIYIFKYKNLNVGQVRTDTGRVNNIFIDYAVSNEFRGQGLGYKMLKMIYKKIPKNMTIVALVKKNNIPSIKIFEKLGYRVIKNYNKNILKYEFKK